MEGSGRVPHDVCCVFLPGRWGSWGRWGAVRMAGESYSKQARAPQTCCFSRLRTEFWFFVLGLGTCSVVLSLRTSTGWLGALQGAPRPGGGRGPHPAPRHALTGGPGCAIIKPHYPPSARLGHGPPLIPAARLTRSFAREFIFKPGGQVQGPCRPLRRAARCSPCSRASDPPTPLPPPWPIRHAGPFLSRHLSSGLGQLLTSASSFLSEASLFLQGLGIPVLLGGSSPSVPLCPPLEPSTLSIRGPTVCGP